MPTHSPLADSKIDADSVIDQSTMFGLRDNPIAVAAGDSSVADSYRIEPKAFRAATEGNYIECSGGYSWTSTIGSSAKHVEFLMTRGGQFKTRLVMACTASGGGGAPSSITAQIYKNGSSIGTSRNLGSATGTATHNEAMSAMGGGVTVAAGDLIQVYLYDAGGTFASGSVTLYLASANPITPSRHLDY